MTNKIDKEKYCKNLKPAFTQCKKAIVFESSEYFVPYLSVVLLSLLARISQQNCYDIIILTHEIDAYDCRQLLKLTEEFDNVKLRFFDPSQDVKKYIQRSRYK